MSLRARVLMIWKDPVGSNVIAGAIVAFAGYVYLQVTAGVSSSSLFARPVARVGVPVVVLATAIVIWRRHLRRRKTLVFLSAGGTCRDPMAKAIATELLNSKKPRPRIEIRAVGLVPSSHSEASYAARYVIREMYGQDLLKDHRPEVLTPDLVAQADLILAMDKSLLLTPGKTLPATKAFVFKEFLGLQGDIIDPWPDGKDSATLDRYRACAEELRALLTAHMDRILKVLEV